MAILLHIETAVSGASICLSADTEVLAEDSLLESRDSASWIHPALQKLLASTKVKPEAISVSAGPGSYTGLRVGMATGKGLCYGMNIPLILLPTLELMARSFPFPSKGLLCPMIDARRQEVFTALFNGEGQVISEPHNLILHSSSFEQELKAQTISFFGNGSTKFQSMISHSNARFFEHEPRAKGMVPWALEKYLKRDFASLAYAEPLYTKDFHSPAKQSL